MEVMGSTCSGQPHLARPYIPRCAWGVMIKRKEKGEIVKLPPNLDIETFAAIRRCEKLGYEVFLSFLSFPFPLCCVHLEYSKMEMCSCVKPNHLSNLLFTRCGCVLDVHHEWKHGMLRVLARNTSNTPVDIRNASPMERTVESAPVWMHPPRKTLSKHSAHTWGQ